MFILILKFFLAFLLGALAFTPWDILLVRFEIVEYSHPLLWGVSSWTPLIFGVVTLLAVGLCKLIDRLMETQAPYSPGYLLYEYLVLSAIFTLILLFRTYPYILSLSLGGLVLARLIIFHRKGDFLFFLIGACVGPTVELFLTGFKVYLFTEPDFLGMPYWLPLLWGSVALSLRRLSWALFPLAPAQRSAYSIKLK